MINTNTAEQSVISLYSAHMDPYSHRVRIVVQEKEAAHDLILINEDEPSEDFLALSPYQALPVLVDRDLVLFDTMSILEYMDERYPHPPLMPVDPAERAKIRQMIMRIDRDWTSKVIALQSATGRAATTLTKELKDSILVLAPVFDQYKYFMGDEYSLVDCALAPILWQLQLHNMALPESAQPILDYAERLFERETFEDSLTEYEEELREAV